HQYARAGRSLWPPSVPAACGRWHVRTARLLDKGRRAAGGRWRVHGPTSAGARRFRRRSLRAAAGPWSPRAIDESSIEYRRIVYDVKCFFHNGRVRLSTPQDLIAHPLRFFLASLRATSAEVARKDAKEF